MKILIICTGNSCRSQMAHGFLKSFNPTLNVYSCGIKPEVKVNPYAVKVMQEVGIDIGNHLPVRVEEYINKSFDYVFTVCDIARKMCPDFTGEINNWLHVAFEDPANYKGTLEQKLNEYRRIRDQILESFKELYNCRLLK